MTEEELKRSLDLERDATCRDFNLFKGWLNEFNWLQSRKSRLKRRAWKKAESGLRDELCEKVARLSADLDFERAELRKVRAKLKTMEDSCGCYAVRKAVL